MVRPVLQEKIFSFHEGKVAAIYPVS